MHVAQQARVSWAGVVSGYFPVDNGVRQGGVLSPVYIDNLLCIDCLGLVLAVSLE